MLELARKVLMLSLMAPLVSGVAVAAPGTTAKEALSAAKGKALEWQGDAALTSIGADVDRNGRVSTPVGWAFTFSSKRAHRDFDVYVGANREIRKAEERRLPGVLPPITGDFIDSNKAMAEALAGGLPDGLVLHATLAAHCPASSKEPLCWEILSLTPTGQVTFVVGAKSGKLLAKP
jgi:hypothetical protein